MFIVECRTDIGLPPIEKGTSSQSDFRQIFSLKANHILAFFVFLYVGLEVTIGGNTVYYCKRTS
jgi:fucose permease